MRPLAVVFADVEESEFQEFFVDDCFVKVVGHTFMQSIEVLVVYNLHKLPSLLNEIAVIILLLGKTLMHKICFIQSNNFV